MFLEKTAGPTDTFTGAMASAVVKKAKTIRVLTPAVFAVLDYMYPNNDAMAVNPNTVTYPALAEIDFVKKFQLTSGSIQVVYFAGKSEV